MIRFTLCCAGLLGFAAASLPGQSFVQISSIRARPAALTCVGPGATSRVRVQIYVAGIPESAKQSTVMVNLSVYAARPSISKMDLRDPSKEIPLSTSPALVDFEVNCTADTRSGVMQIGATITSAPEGILIKEPTVPPVVDIKILPQPH